MYRTIVAMMTVLLALALTRTTFAQAPSATTPSPHARHAGHPFKALDLTADQKAQVKAIMQQARTDAQNATDPQAKHAIRKAAFQKIKDTVLTDAQRTQLEQMRANHKKGKCASQPAHS